MNHWGPCSAFYIPSTHLLSKSYLTSFSPSRPYSSGDSSWTGKSKTKLNKTKDYTSSNATKNKTRRSLSYVKWLTSRGDCWTRRKTSLRNMRDSSWSPSQPRWCHRLTWSSWRRIRLSWILRICRTRENTSLVISSNFIHTSKSSVSRGATKPSWKKGSDSFLFHLHIFFHFQKNIIMFLLSLLVLASAMPY